MVEQLAEALEMHHLALAQEFYNLVHVGVVGQAQDIVVSSARLLLCGKVLHKVRYGVGLGLEIRRRKRNAARVRRVYRVRMVNVIIRFAVPVEAFRALAVGKLPYYAADYL